MHFLLALALCLTLLGGAAAQDAPEPRDLYAPQPGDTWQVEATTDLITTDDGTETTSRTHWVYTAEVVAVDGLLPHQTLRTYTSFTADDDALTQPLTVRLTRGAPPEVVAPANTPVPPFMAQHLAQAADDDLVWLLEALPDRPLAPGASHTARGETLHSDEWPDLDHDLSHRTHTLLDLTHQDGLELRHYTSETLLVTDGRSYTEQTSVQLSPDSPALTFERDFTIHMTIPQDDADPRVLEFTGHTRLTRSVP